MHVKQAVNLTDLVRDLSSSSDSDTNSDGVFEPTQKKKKNSHISVKNKKNAPRKVNTPGTFFSSDDIGNSDSEEAGTSNANIQTSPTSISKERSNNLEEHPRSALPSVESSTSGRLKLKQRASIQTQPGITSIEGSNPVVKLKPFFKGSKFSR